MDLNEREALKRISDTVEENNKILKSIRRGKRWGIAFRVFYWIVIIGASVGAFYYIQPYIDNAKDAYQKVQGTLSGVKSATDKVQSITK